MSTVMERIVSSQDQLLELMSSLQKPVVSVVTRTASLIDAGVERLPKLPSLPFMEELPKAQELVEVQFGFAAKLIDLHKQFALDLANAVDGIGSGEETSEEP
jgi:hypothetical protein